MHWIYLIHKFHNLSWITEINELFYDILYWDAPVNKSLFKSNLTDMGLFVLCQLPFLCSFHWCDICLGVGKGSGDNFKMEMSQVGFSAHQTRNKVPALCIYVFPSILFKRFPSCWFTLTIGCRTWSYWEQLEHIIGLAPLCTKLLRNQLFCPKLLLRKSWMTETTVHYLVSIVLA